MKIASLVRYAAILLFGVVIAVVSIVSIEVNDIRFGGKIQRDNQQISDLIADILPPPKYIIESYLETTLLLQDPASFDTHAARLDQLHDEYDERQAYWTAAPLDANLRKALTQDADHDAQAFWTELDEQFLPAAKRGDQAAAAASYQRLTASYRAHRAQIDTTLVATKAYGEKLAAVSHTRLSFASFMIIGGAAVVIAMLCGFIFLIINRVSAPLARATKTMCKLADGDVTVAIDGLQRRDEIGDMAKALAQFRAAEEGKRSLQESERLNQMRQRAVIEVLREALRYLAEGKFTYRVDDRLDGEYKLLQQDFNSAMTAMASALRAVTVASDMIRTGSSEIAQASSDLAARTETQSFRLQDTADSINSMTSAVATNAQQAQQVRVAVASAQAQAATGGAIVQSAIEAMRSIETSSSEIAEIIALIDGIAFQTNLLALNAGVEAARAGDAGNGFAVVASEVRALAQRSADAGRDIRALITASGRHVTAGVKLVSDTGACLGTIVGDVERIGTLIEGIALAVEDEAVKLSGINGTMMEMDKMTQQNAAMVEQSTAAARSLAHEADALALLVSNFDIEIPESHTMEHLAAGTRALPAARRAA